MAESSAPAPYHAAARPNRRSITCAVAAARRDSRFAPVQLSELDGLRLEISLLTPPERIAGLHELDPARYGLVVSAGDRRGVLLPAIDGIDSPREQLRIALHKAGLCGDDLVELERFEILKLIEPDLLLPGGDA